MIFDPGGHPTFRRGRQSFEINQNFDDQIETSFRDNQEQN